MTLEQLKTMSNNLVQAIHDYTQEKDFDSIELERTLDELLCRLPRDMIYVEWFDRSQIKDMADSVYDEPVNADTVDNCMYDLWRLDESIMDDETVQDCVNESVRFAHEHKGDNND